MRTHTQAQKGRARAGGTYDGHVVAEGAADGLLVEGTRGVGGLGRTAGARGQELGGGGGGEPDLASSLCGHPASVPQQRAHAQLLRERFSPLDRRHGLPVLEVARGGAFHRGGVLLRMAVARDVPELPRVRDADRVQRARGLAQRRRGRSRRP